MFTILKLLQDFKDKILINKTITDLFARNLKLIEILLPPNLEIIFLTIDILPWNLNMFLWLLIYFLKIWGCFVIVSQKLPITFRIGKIFHSYSSLDLLLSMVNILLNFYQS